MTQEQKAVNFETMEHIHKVMSLLTQIIVQLLRRANDHDRSKLISPEAEIFLKYTEKLATSTYGSPEYKQFLEEMKPALDHHYANNRHHPEHYQDGVDDMTLIDLVEMLSDWKAATMRHNDGNILKSIDINSKRFNIDAQLAKILNNTVSYLGW
jgi:hypothetical protein